MARTTATLDETKDLNRASSFHGFWQREAVFGYLLILPAMVLIILLVVYPFFNAIQLSMSDALIGRETNFIGLSNYLNLFKSGIFLQTLQNSILFTVAAVAVKAIAGTVLALLLNENVRFKKFFRGAILLPWVIPTALSTLAWWWMFDSLYSVINWTLVYLGIVKTGLQWLSKPYLAMISVILVNIWRGLPFFAITILAGLVSIPKELYEAAETDGAGPWTKFRHITLPMIKPVLGIVILFSTIFTLSDFNIVFILTRGGPMNMTHLFGTLSYTMGIVGGKIGEGAAIALFLFPFLLAVVYLQLRMIHKEEY